MVKYLKLWFGVEKYSQTSTKTAHKLGSMKCAEKLRGAKNPHTVEWNSRISEEKKGKSLSNEHKSSISKTLIAKGGVDKKDAVPSWPTIEEMKKFKVKAGRGVGAVEAPRGILFHDYTINENAIVEKANCVIPTNQNLANIDADFRKMIPEILNKSKEEIVLQSEMLVRAYDPCISCSCHYIDITFLE